MHYLAFVQRDETGAYLATLPDFPGCSATAPSWLQLENAIRIAVRLHVRTRLEPVPPPTPIELFTEDSAPPNSCWMQVALFAHEVQPAPSTRRRPKGTQTATSTAMLEGRAPRMHRAPVPPPRHADHRIDTPSLHDVHTP